MALVNVVPAAKLRFKQLVEMKIAPGGGVASKSPVVALCGPSLSAASWISVAVSAIILSICRCANASPQGNALASPPLIFEPPAGREGAGAPEGWTTLTLSFDDAGKIFTTNVAMRAGADEAEVQFDSRPVPIYEERI